MGDPVGRSLQARALAKLWRLSSHDRKRVSHESPRRIQVEIRTATVNVDETGCGDNFRKSLFVVGVLMLGALSKMKVDLVHPRIAPRRMPKLERTLKHGDLPVSVGLEKGGSIGDHHAEPSACTQHAVRLPQNV